MKFINKNKNIIVILLAVVVAGVFYYINRPLNLSNSTVTTTDNQDTTSEEQTNQQTEITDCELTPEDGQGPYYISDSPNRTDLAPEGAEGEKLVINGQVLDQNCQPVPNATIDIWHADANGEYQDDWFRGKVVTGNNGEYQFETVMPASYGEGATRRPAHIHYKVWVDEEEILTSQMYFSGRLLPEFAQTKVVEVERVEDGLEGEFDVVLELQSST